MKSLRARMDGGPAYVLVPIDSTPLRGTEAFALFDGSCI